MERDFVGYGQTPPDFTWPGGARLALSVVLNIEEGAERSPLDGDPFVEQANETTYPVRPGERELTTETMYEFGSRVGAWRLLRVLDRYPIGVSVLVSALALERTPELAGALASRDWDLLGHGLRWIDHAGLSPDEEARQVREARSRIEALTGRRIVGWHTRSPLTPQTREVLAHEGFLYDCGAFNDELPYYTPVDGRPFLIVPYSLDTNDIGFWRGRLFTASDFAAYCIDAFDWLLEESLASPRMMSVGLHPRIIGRPGRVRGLVRFLDHVAGSPDVWFARRTEIARFWAERYAPPDAWNWPEPR